MKRLILILLCILALSGCSALAPDSYLSITPHENAEIQPVTIDAITATDFRSLKDAILTFVRAGQPEGIVHVYNYHGSVETDLPKAAYEVCSLDPLGAYAVDYMTHSCNRLVSYYEIRISTTFRRTIQEISSIHSVNSDEEIKEILATTVSSYADRTAFLVQNYRGQDEDIPTYINQYYNENYATVMEVPSISISIYPETGSTRIIEVNSTYKNVPQHLQAKQQSVENNVTAAVEYIRYREQDYEKMQLLYSYMTQRFQYHKAKSATPLYDALCSGVADPVGLSQAWKMICDKTGVECLIVSGMKQGEPYTWNIIRTGSYYRHLDLAQCIMNRTGLVTASDSQMEDYYWNTKLYPACEPLPAVQPPAEESTDSKDADVTEEIETPEETETPDESPKDSPVVNDSDPLLPAPEEPKQPQS